MTAKEATPIIYKKVKQAKCSIPVLTLYNKLKSMENKGKSINNKTIEIIVKLIVEKQTKGDN
jgi:trans-2-enoyl-CoA reductase